MIPSWKDHPIPSYKQGFARSQYESARPQDWRGLVALYLPTLGPSGLTLYDWGGKKLHGTLTNMTPATDWVIGREMGYALDIDHLNDSAVLFPTDAKFGNLQSGLGPMSFVTWFNKPAYNGVGFDHLIRYDRLGKELIFEAVTVSGWGNDNMMLTVFDFGTTELRRQTSNNTIALNTTHCAICTWTGESAATSAHIYIDGKEPTYRLTQNGVGSRSSGPASIWKISDHSGGGNRTWNGEVFQVRFYNRVITPQEAMEIYRDPFGIVRPLDPVWARIEAPAGTRRIFVT